jgi:hypothetical protein
MEKNKNVDKHRRTLISNLVETAKAWTQATGIEGCVDADDGLALAVQQLEDHEKKYGPTLWK